MGVLFVDFGTKIDYERDIDDYLNGKDKAVQNFTKLKSGVSYRITRISVSCRTSTKFHLFLLNYHMKYWKHAKEKPAMELHTLPILLRTTMLTF
jgi:hypothetical protein